MKIRCLFGQMHEEYEGQVAPELLCAVDEYVLEVNPEHWQKERTRVLADGYDKNFVAMLEVEIKVSEDEIRHLFKTPEIKGSVQDHGAKETL